MRATTRLRQLLAQPRIVVAPGAYDALLARLKQDGTSRSLLDRMYSFGEFNALLGLEEYFDRERWLWGEGEA